MPRELFHSSLSISTANAVLVGQVGAGSGPLLQLQMINKVSFFLLSLSLMYFCKGGSIVSWLELNMGGIFIVVAINFLKY